MMVQVTNRKIKDVQLTDCELVITFDDNKIVMLHDNIDPCCEERYVKTIFNVKSLIGHKINSFSIKRIIKVALNHEILETRLDTTNGRVTLVFNNIHNGFHSGISVMWSDFTPYKIKCEGF